MSQRSLLGLFLFLSLRLPVGAQVDPCTQTIPTTTRTPAEPAHRRDPETQIREEMRRTQEKKANQERQASLKKDTEDLLKLATELKTSVDQTTEHTLSVAVIKKAQEIEKLAKEVRERMKGNSYCDFQGP